MDFCESISNETLALSCLNTSSVSQGSTAFKTVSAETRVLLLSESKIILIVVPTVSSTTRVGSPGLTRSGAFRAACAERLMQTEKSKIDPKNAIPVLTVLRFRNKFALERTFLQCFWPRNHDLNLGLGKQIL